MNSLVAPALGFVGGFFTAIFAEPLRRWIYAPRLELSFGTSQHFLTKTPEVTPNSKYESLYVRIKAVNVRSALAKGCRAYLVNVERKGPSGFEPTEYCESLQLAWASQDTQSFAAFDLPRDVPHFVDIISTRPTSPAFTFATRVTPLRYMQLVQTPGTYKFTVVVSGDGVKPVTIQAIVAWTGVWDQVSKVGS